MKTFKFSLVAALAAVVMMTSCIGDGNNEVTALQYGIVKSSDYGLTKLFHCNSYYSPIYLSNINSEISEGDYLYVQYTINFDSEYNTDAMVTKNGYYVGQVIGYTDDIRKVSLYSYKQFDIENKLENEVIFKGITLNDIVDKVLFADLGVGSIPEKSTVTYSIELDNSQTPTKGSISGYDANIYDVYLRVTVAESEEEKNETHGETCGLDLRSNSIFENIYSKEIGNDNYHFGLQVHYVSQFDDDAETVKTWSKIQTIVPIVTGKNN